MRSVNALSTKLLILLVYFGSSCQRDSTITTKAITEKAAVVTSKAPNSLALSYKIVEEVELALIANGVDTTQAKVIANGALAGLDGATSPTGLALTSAEHPGLDTMVPLLLTGAIATLGDDAAGIGDLELKLKLTGVISQATFLSLAGKMDGLTDEQKQDLPASLTKAAVSTLDEAGLSGDALSSGIGAVMDSAVGNLKSAGFESKQMQTLVSKITKSSIEGMSNAGIATTQVAAAVQSMMSRTIAALDNTGVEPGDVASFVGPIMTQAISGLTDLGLKNAGQMQSIVGDLMGSAVSALSQAGVKEAKDIKGALTSAVQGAMTGVGNSGVKGDKMANYMGSMMKGAVGSLDKIGLKDTAAIKNLSASVTADSISFLGNVGITDTASMKSISSAVASGTMNALGKLMDSGSLSAEDVKDATKTVSEKAVEAILTQSINNGAQADMTTIASGFTTGMVSGLAEAGWKASEITTVSQNISSGFKQALEGKESVDQTALDSMASVIKSGADSWVEDMKIHCQKEKGIWHADGKCEYPSKVAATGALGPNPEEQAKCDGDGGEILFKGDLTWFCDISAGGSELLATLDGCRAKGYLWVRGPGGNEYCELSTPPTNCWASLDEGSCISTGGECSWIKTYCEASAFVTCESFHGSQTSCASRAGCFWDPSANLCLGQDPCKINPANPICSSATAGQPPPPDASQFRFFSPKFDEIRIEWQSSGGSTVGFGVSYQLGEVPPANCQVATQVPQDQLSPGYTIIRGLMPNTPYAFRLCAYNGDAIPDISPGLVGIMRTRHLAPPEASNLEVVPTGSNSLRVSWARPVDAPIDYVIAMAEGQVPPTNCNTPAATAAQIGLGNAFEFFGLAPAQFYTMRLCVLNRNTPPEMSLGVVATSKTLEGLPSNPVNFTVQGQSSSSISLAWNFGMHFNARFRLAYQAGSMAPPDCNSPQVTEGQLGNSLSHTVSGLNANSQYSFRVCALNGRIPADVSPGVVLSAWTQQGAPGNVSGISSSGVSHNGLTLNWGAATGASSYRIKYSIGSAPTNCDSPQINEGQIASATTYTINGLMSNTNYHFAVCSINGNTNPDVSFGPTYSVSTLQEPPSELSGLNATADSSNQITLTWNHNGGSTTGYLISFATGGYPADCTSPNQNLGVTTSFQVNALNSSTSYYFRVCATNGSTVSSGLTATATTSAPSLPEPTGLDANSTNSNTSLNVYWTAAGGSVNSYRIVYRPAGVTLPANCSSPDFDEMDIGVNLDHTINGLTPFTEYNIRICSYSSTGPTVSGGAAFSAWTIDASGLPSPTNLVATPDSSSAITLQWNDPSGLADSHVIEYGTTFPTAPTCSSPTMTNVSNPVQITGLNPSDTYYFRVCNVAPGANPYHSVGSVVSQGSYESTFANNPPTPVVTFVSDNQAVMTWDSIGDAEYYLIQFATNDEIASRCSSPTGASATNSYTLTGLSPNMTFTARVCPVKNGGLNVSTGSTVVFRMPISDPSPITVQALSSSELRFDWSGAGSEGVRIVYAQGTTPPADCSTGYTSVASGINTHTVASLLADTNYAYRICNVSFDNISMGKSGVVRTGEGGYPLDPINFRTNSISSTHMDLAWDHPSTSPATGYRLQWTQGSTPPPERCPSPNFSYGNTTTNSYDFYGLVSGSNYSIRICSDNAGTVSKGVVISEWTSGGAYPAEHSSVTAEALGANLIRLDWVPGPGTMGTKIVWDTISEPSSGCFSGANFMSASMIGANTAVDLSTGFSPNTPVFIRVCSIGPGSNPASSLGVLINTAASSAGTPQNPRTPTITAATESSVTIAWDGVTNATGYKISHQAGYTVPTSACDGGQTTAGTSYTISNLSAGTLYTILLCSVDANVSPGIHIRAWTPGGATPQNPTSVRATPISTSAIKLTWTPMGMPVGHRIVYASGGTAPSNCSGASILEHMTAGGNEYTITSLNVDQEYSFRICAVGQGAFSPPVSSGVVVSNRTGEGGAIPLNPSSLWSMASNNYVDINWTAPSPSPTDYLVSWNHGDNPPPEFCSSNFTSTTNQWFSIAALNVNEQITVRVCSRNGTDVSRGVVLTDVTQGAPMPRNPRDVALEVVSSSKLRLSWVSPGPEVAGYRISYDTSTNPSDYCNSNTIIQPYDIGSQLSYEIAGLNPDSTLKVRICALTSGTNPTASKGIVVGTYTKASNAPPNIAAIIVEPRSSSIQLNWSDPGQGTTGYRVVYQQGTSLAVGCTDGTVGYDGSNLSAEVTSLSPNNHYFFRICSFDGSNYSQGYTFEDMTQGASPPRDPLNVNARTAGFNRIDLSWAVPNVGGGAFASYAIQYQEGFLPPHDCNRPQILGSDIAGNLNWSIVDLDPETTYAIRVCALGNGSAPAASGGIVVIASTSNELASLWNVPTPTMTSISDTAAQINWINPQSAGNFRISIVAGSEAPPEFCHHGSSVDVGNANLYYGFTSLLADTLYTARICTFSNGTSPVSLSSGVPVSFYTKLDGVTPANPTRVTATAYGDTTIGIYWEEVSDATSYDVKVSTSPLSDCSMPSQSSVNYGQTIVSGLAANTRYYVRVCSNDGADISSGTETQVWTASSPSHAANPSNLIAIPGLDGTSMTLHWSPSLMAASYRIAYAASTAPANCSSGMQISESTVMGASSYRISGLTSGTSYGFRICATDSFVSPVFISSGATKTATTLAAPPANPSGPSATSVTTSTMTLDWTDNGGGSGFWISYRKGPMPPSHCDQYQVETASPTLSLTGLSPNQDYSFRICAISSGSPASVSSGVTITQATAN